ncbi:hypothetical protein HDU81_000264, partial [Chytriomyces hyalinus]
NADDTEAQYLNVGNGEFQLLTEVMGVLVCGAVTELEAWEAWEELRSSDWDSLPEVECSLIGQVVVANWNNALAAKHLQEEEDALASKCLSVHSTDYPQEPVQKAALPT